MISAMHGPGPKRESRQRSRTRAALLTAGQQLFAARSAESVTIDDIVDAAAVAKGSFYNHFDDKGAFARAIFEFVQGDVESHISSVNRDILDPPARIVRALFTVLDYASRHPERLQAMLSLSERGRGLASPLNIGLAADIRGGLEQGRLRGIDVESGILIVIGLTNVAVGYATSNHVDFSAFATTMAAGVLRALGMPFTESEAVAQQAAHDLLQRAN